MMPQISTFLVSLLLPVLGIMAFAYIPLQVYTVSRWAGVWRFAALVPPLAILLAYPYFASAVSDPNNQFGSFAFYGIFEAGIGGAYLVILMVLRALVLKPRGDRGSPSETSAPSLPSTLPQEDARFQSK